MRLFGLEITRSKTVPSTGLTAPAPYSWMNWSSGSWWPIVRESYQGAWQQNVEVRLENVLAYAPVMACIRLISSDIGKLRPKLMQQDGEGIWTETERPAFSPVLRKPNHYQTRIQFLEQWLVSKLMHGNTYVLKQRDNRRVVTDLYVLHPLCVKPLVAPDGSVFYELKRDPLSQQYDEAVIVPASEIIHDIYFAPYHPLVGVSPITACGLAAIQALRIQNNSAQFFGNGSQPGGVLTAPGFIKDETAKRLKEYWETAFSGENVGKVAVLGDGLKYEAMSVNATDAQLIEQLKWTAHDVCTAFNVPPYMIGVGPMPTYNNIEALNAQYYAQCLQTLIEKLELLLDEGLGLGLEGDTRLLGIELDLDALLRMDTATRVKAAADAIGAGVLSPNEARKRYFDVGSVKGGETPYLQQQNFSLAALAERDANDPFSKPAPAPAASTTPVEEDEADVEREVGPMFLKEWVAAA